MISKVSGTRSYITVEFDDKTIGMEGELTLKPAFYADKKSMKNLTRPESVLSVGEKEQIAEEILLTNSDREFEILF
jgi:hypothetical protein